MSEKDLYFVAVKILLRDGDKLLIIRDIFDDGWDIPGGRLRQHEFAAPLADVIARKMQEEVGSEVQYSVKEPVVFFRHERIESETGKRVRIFAVGYEAEYLGGAIKLGDHHEKYEWVDINHFTPAKYFTGGWCQGLEEYLEKMRNVK